MSGDVETAARAVCRERCSFMGEPPCWEVGAWPNEECDEPGCHALAKAAIAAWNRRAPDYAAGAEAMREAAQRAATPTWKRGCTCSRCDCGNTDDACGVADWDARTEVAAAICALPLPEPPK